MASKDHVFTLGIEEEFQIIDPETRELRVIHSREKRMQRHARGH